MGGCFGQEKSSALAAASLVGWQCPGVAGDSWGSTVGRGLTEGSSKIG